MKHFKTGDLVRLCPLSYPQHKGKSGLLVRAHLGGIFGKGDGWWHVFIGGRIHPYPVNCDDLTL